MKQIKCPNCGANLSISEDKSQFFCEYCGAKIIDSGGKITYEIVERIVDEAKIKEIELEANKEKSNSTISVLARYFLFVIGIGIAFFVILPLFAKLINVIL